MAAANEYHSPGNEYMKHLKSYTPDTGDWLRESEVFRSWEDDTDKGCLWVRGIAGSGKSVFAAATVKNARRDTGRWRLETTCLVLFLPTDRRE
ncbi:hypothetical protein BKA61DRAFT_616595 [Leptodontidium sp. MPI-SDFR-AT-0119]|nr:hypothetical protein BKA61DRAFT_616595 [Leptodontidium sp. MPI-SDFR-AT-0119]